MDRDLAIRDAAIRHCRVLACKRGAGTPAFAALAFWLLLTSCGATAHPSMQASPSTAVSEQAPAAPLQEPFAPPPTEEVKTPGAKSSAEREPETKEPEPFFPESTCASRAFFELYVRDGLVEPAPEGVLQVRVPVDLHFQSCGGPECWGHDMTLRLELRHQGERCEIVRAEASGVPFNGCGVPMDIGPQSPWTNTFVVHGSPNLADPELKQIELRDPTRKEAVLLLRTGYFYYEKVTSWSQLFPSLEGDDSTGCCYGHTSSATNWWSLDD